MNSSRNFRSIPVIIFVNNLHLVLLIDFEKRLKSFTSQTKRVPGLLDAEEFSFLYSSAFSLITCTLSAKLGAACDWLL
jgi:hypothetical protein